MTVYFCSHKEVEPYGCFSNFSAHGFSLDKRHWRTSEHYFQAQKCVGTQYSERIRLAPTPGEAARIGRDRSLPLRPDWEAVKDTVMTEALLAKFTTHDDIRAVLLSTGDAPMVENSPHDYYWGCGKDGSGKNRLGQLLVDLRTLFRTQPSRQQGTGPTPTGRNCIA